MKFSHFAETEADRKPSQKRAKEVVREQLDYLYGALAHDKNRGVPRGDEKFAVTGIERVEPGLYRVNYDYEGVTLLDKGPRKWTSFDLPRDPSEEGAYYPGLDVDDVNRSTDDHYQDFGDYWYFWQPRKRGSLLEEGKDYHRVKASIQRFPNTRRTYPEYEKLVDEKTGTIPMMFVFGMDEATASKNANRSQDLGAQGYRGLRKGLREMGFEPVELTKREIREPFGRKRIETPWVERFEKDTPKGKMVATLFFGPSGMDEASRAFHHYWKNALETQSLALYDGHSGLGDHLDLDQIQAKENFKIKTDPDRYQIFCFNSCSSYSYYNRSYHVLKPGGQPTKKMDILANGLESDFDDTQAANLALVRAIDKWATTGKRESYQQLAEVMEKANLFTVNGDEDNPTK